MVAQRGRPLNASTAWNQLAHATLPRDDSQQDAFRRRVITRAEHRDAYIHPSLIADVRRNEQHVLTHAHAARFDGTLANLHLHVVPADAWPFTVDQRFASLLVAWLDLADRGDRAERLTPPDSLTARKNM